MKQEATHNTYVVSTKLAKKALGDANVSANDLISRHCAGDWGKMSDWDIVNNIVARLHGEPVLSVFPLPSGENICVFTDFDRLITILFVENEHLAPETEVV